MGERRGRERERKKKSRERGKEREREREREETMEEWERKERTDGRLRRGGSEGGDEDSSRPSLREREKEILSFL